MQIIKSREQLEFFEGVSYPKMSSTGRKSLFKRTKMIAIPSELDSSAILTTDQAQQKVKDFLSGK